MNNTLLTKDGVDVKVICSLDHNNKYVVWFFGEPHELLEGTSSEVLERCSHRIFDTEEEFLSTKLQPMISDGWYQLNDNTF